MLVTIVESDPEGSLFNSYYTECKEEYYSFRLIAPLDPWYVPYNPEC